MSDHPVQPQTLPSRRKYWDLSDPSQEEIFLEPELLALIRLRIAQLHGCPLCQETHREEFKALGGSDMRIVALKEWQKSSLFDDTERTALALTDILSADPSGPVPLSIVQEAREHFNEAEILQLVLNVFAANDWIYESPRHPDGIGQRSRYRRHHGEAN